MTVVSDLDRLAALLEQFRVRTRLFHAGPLCGVTEFPARPGRGFLHILRSGTVEVAHEGAGGSEQRLQLTRPSVVFYPRPLEHAFHNEPVDGTDFACASLDIDGGSTHPLLGALPAVVVIALDDAEELRPVLEILFTELDQVRCGNRVLADRLFEVVLIQLFRWLLDHPDHTELSTGLITGLADERLARALVAIHEAPGEPWTLTAMAQQAGMSRSAFAPHFKTVVGQTPAAYLTDWRMTLAQGRLRAGSSVSRTATDLGYATAPAFSRAFAARVGCSPREWLASTSERREALVDQVRSGPT